MSQDTYALRLELTALLRLLVEEPDAVRVTETPERSGVTFEASVDQEDLGKIIGRQGRTARALRNLLEVRGAGEDRRYGLRIREH